MSGWRSSPGNHECVVLEDEREDPLDRLLHALRRPGADGRVVRRRVAATVALVLLFFAVLAVAGLYALALSGLAVLTCSALGVVAMAVVRPRRASTAAQVRRALASSRRLCARACSRWRPLWNRLPDRDRALALARLAATRSVLLASSTLRVVRTAAADVRVVDTFEEAAARVRASDRTLRAAEAAKALLKAAQPSSDGAQVREALRLNAAGTTLRRAGAFAEAAEQHRRALAVFDELGDRRAAALTKNNLALALERTGDDTALDLFEDAATTLGELGDEQSEGQVIANLAVGLRRRGQVERAEDAIERALEKLEEHSPEYDQVDSLRRAS